MQFAWYSDHLDAIKVASFNDTLDLMTRLVRYAPFACTEADGVSCAGIGRGSESSRDSSRRVQTTQPVANPKVATTATDLFNTSMPAKSSSKAENYKRNSLGQNVSTRARTFGTKLPARTTKKSNVYDVGQVRRAEFSDDDLEESGEEDDMDVHSEDEDESDMDSDGDGSFADSCSLVDSEAELDEEIEAEMEDGYSDLEDFIVSDADSIEYEDSDNDDGEDDGDPNDTDGYLDHAPQTARQRRECLNLRSQLSGPAWQKKDATKRVPRAYNDSVALSYARKANRISLADAEKKLNSHLRLLGDARIRFKMFAPSADEESLRVLKKDVAKQESLVAKQEAEIQKLRELLREDGVPIDPSVAREYRLRDAEEESYHGDTSSSDGDGDDNNKYGNDENDIIDDDDDDDYDDDDDDDLDDSLEISEDVASDYTDD